MNDLKNGIGSVVIALIFIGIPITCGLAFAQNWAYPLPFVLSVFVTSEIIFLSAHIYLIDEDLEEEEEDK